MLKSDKPFSDVAPILLEANDRLDWSEETIILEGVTWTGQDGMNFSVPAGAKVLMSYESNGVSNPHQWRVGASGQPPAPAGYIRVARKLPNGNPDPLQSGIRLGLFVHRDAASGELSFFWFGDGESHDLSLKIFTPNGTAANAVLFEPTDSTENGSHVVAVTATAHPGDLDGVRIPNVGANEWVAWVFHQDGIFQPRRASGRPEQSPNPNAYWLP